MQVTLEHFINGVLEEDTYEGIVRVEAQEISDTHMDVRLHTINGPFTVENVISIKV